MQLTRSIVIKINNSYRLLMCKFVLNAREKITSKLCDMISHFRLISQGLWSLFNWSFLTAFSINMFKFLSSKLLRLILENLTVAWCLRVLRFMRYKFMTVFVHKILSKLKSDGRLIWLIFSFMIIVPFVTYQHLSKWKESKQSQGFEVRSRDVTLKNDRCLKIKFEIQRQAYVFLLVDVFFIFRKKIIDNLTFT